MEDANIDGEENCNGLDGEGLEKQNMHFLLVFGDIRLTIVFMSFFFFGDIRLMIVVVISSVNMFF